MSINPSARAQFASSISLVIDNDREAYMQTRERAKRLNDVFKLAEYLRDAVEYEIEKTIGTADTIGAMLIRELCNGWGIDAYIMYARDILAELDERKAV